EGSPDPRVVDRRAAERAGRAARHPPRDLGPRPGLRHLPGGVHDRALGDLAGVPPPDLHGPVARLRVVRRLVTAARVGIAREPCRHLRIALEGREGLLLVERGLPGRRDERRLDEVPFPVEDGTCGGGVRRGECRGSEHADGHGDDDGGEETPHRTERRRNDQSLFPTKLSGVTATIATACAESFPSPPPAISRWSTTRFAPSAATETTKKRIPWTPTCPRSSRNVQSRFQV